MYIYMPTCVSDAPRGLLQLHGHRVHPVGLADGAIIVLLLHM